MRRPRCDGQARSAAGACPRARVRPKHARRSEPAFRRCRAGSRSGPGPRGAVRAPRGGALTSRRLVCRVVSSGLGRERFLKLAATGTAAGLFSGLLGVGGGTVIVPLLVLWLGYPEHEATGTSLAAIVG